VAPPEVELVGESLEGVDVALDGDEVRRGPTDGLQAGAIGVAQQGTRRRHNRTLEDARGHKDIRAGIARAHVQRLVTVSRGQDSYGTLGAEHASSLPCAGCSVDRHSGIAASAHGEYGSKMR